MRSSSAQKGMLDVSGAVVPLQIRGRFLTAVVLPITGAPDDAFYEAVDAALRQSPRFFANAPLVIDVAGAPVLESAEAFGVLLEALRARRLSPIGIQNATAHQTVAAAAHGLITLKDGRDAPLEPPRRGAAKAAPEPASQPVAAPAPPPKRPSLLVTEPVRSGQCIVAEEGDLVIVGSVSSGAELIAHGHIHVYGRLRGRALAGVGGDTSARIFCQSLEAELIAIAGLYKTNEAFETAVAKQRVQAFLEADMLRITPLK